MEYLLQVKVGCMCGLLLLTLICGLGPSKVKWFQDSAGTEAHRMWVSLISCLAGGVFLAACLLDIIPDFLSDISEELQRQQITVNFPLPEFILAAGFLLVLIAEQIILDCNKNRSDEATPLLSSNGHPNHRSHPPINEQDVEGMRHHFHVDFQAHSAFRSFVLILSLSLHSVFEGLAIGLQDTNSEVLKITSAIIVHKSIIAFSLSLLLLESRVQRRWFVLSMVMFAAMSPLGVGLGIAVMQNQSEWNGMVQSVLEGIAAGTFVYITFLEILPHELNSPKWRLPKVIFILLGFSAMAMLQFLE
ncbi:zinc transporter ZIP1-like [Rhinatrema bivittatum]|uniref:zinc transporter ZIP1-like n=1 Tax=Rhinatrema bivittatum TaxID=194408 RepID=UPI001127E48D|nr:zinc transporter ZIP1-like [Rhinatrema bivittatum]